MFGIIIHKMYIQWFRYLLTILRDLCNTEINMVSSVNVISSICLQKGICEIDSIILLRIVDCIFRHHGF